MNNVFRNAMFVSIVMLGASCLYASTPTGGDPVPGTGTHKSGSNFSAEFTPTGGDPVPGTGTHKSDFTLSASFTPTGGDPAPGTGTHKS
jgi:hypothetical protein